MGKAGMNMVVAADRVHLGFAPKPAKGAGKNDPVVILVKGTAPELFGAVMRFSETFAVKQGLPIQGAVLRQ